jgi:hypothetical protein
MLRLPTMIAAEAAFVQHPACQIPDRGPVPARDRHRAGKADMAALLPAIPARHLIERH